MRKLLLIGALIASTIPTTAFSNTTFEDCGTIDVSIGPSKKNEMDILVTFHSNLSHNLDTVDLLFDIDSKHHTVTGDIFYIVDSNNKKIPYIGSFDKRPPGTYALPKGVTPTKYSFIMGESLAFEVNIFESYIRKPGTYKVKYERELSMSFPGGAPGKICKTIKMISNEITIKTTKKAKPIEIDGEIFE